MRSFAPATLVLATRNAGKLRELRALCAEHSVRVLDLTEAGVPQLAREDDIEVHATFAKNARAKASYFAAILDGLPVVAEDSGLVVPALGGDPGVRSRRFAGHIGAPEAVDAANNVLLLERMRGLADRRARFECAACYVGDGRVVLNEGAVDGRVLEAATGHGGFGYDPLFWSSELGCTFAEASADAKARVSHRGRALRALLSAIGLTDWHGPGRLSPASGA